MEVFGQPSRMPRTIGNAQWLPIGGEASFHRKGESMRKKPHRLEDTTTPCGGG